MRKLFFVTGLVLILGLLPLQLYAIQYCQDFLELGNPGGHEALVIELPEFDPRGVDALPHLGGDGAALAATGPEGLARQKKMKNYA